MLLVFVTNLFFVWEDFADSVQKEHREGKKNKRKEIANNLFIDILIHNLKTKNLNVALEEEKKPTIKTT